MMRASTTASLSILFQTIVMGLAIYTFNKNELKRTFIHWKEGMFVGFFAAVTTACWFSAFSLKMLLQLGNIWTNRTFNNINCI